MEKYGDAFVNAGMGSLEAVRDATEHELAGVGLMPNEVTLVHRLVQNVFGVGP